MSSIWSAPASPFALMCLIANFRSALSSNSERSSTPMKGSRSSSEVVGVLEFVQISLHVAVEVPLDVALHHRLGIDEDAGEHVRRRGPSPIGVPLTNTRA